MLKNSIDRLFNKPISAPVRTATNLFTNLYTIVVGLIFVPIYINYLGIELYGIIGAFTGLTAFVWLFDFGVSTNINRELSTFRQNEDRSEALDMKRTLEASSFLISGGIFILLLGISYFLANYWLDTGNFTADFIMSVLVILSFSLAAQFPASFYSNGLMGLNQHAVVNAITIITNTVRCLGAYFAVVYFDDKIHAFLLFQAAAQILSVILLKTALDASTATDGYKGKVDFRLLERLKKFASELFGNNLVTIILTQSDKIILSRMLSLEEFGYYMLAFNIVTMTLNTFSNSITSVIFPNFSRLATKDDKAELIDNFHLATKVMSWGAVSIGSILVLFSTEILNVWTRNSAVAENSAHLLSILALAFSFSTVLMVPYYLQHAFGRSHISFRLNLVQLVIQVPAMIYACRMWGAAGVAMVWLSMQFLYLLIFLPLVRKAFLRFDLKRWYLVDVAVPALVGIAIGLATLQLTSRLTNQVIQVVAIGSCFFLTAAAIYVVSGIRTSRFGFAALMQGRRM